MAGQDDFSPVCLCNISDEEALARISALLKQEDIPFYTKTASADGYGGYLQRAFGARLGKNLYVNTRDEERVRQLLALPYEPVSEAELAEQATQAEQTDVPENDSWRLGPKLLLVILALVALVWLLTYGRQLF